MQKKLKFAERIFPFLVASSNFLFVIEIEVTVNINAAIRSFELIGREKQRLSKNFRKLFRVCFVY